MNPALINVSLGLVGMLFTYAFGGWSEILIFLCIAMAADYITGIAAAIKTGDKLNSEIGFWGLTRKGLILLIILIANQLDLLMNTDMIKGGAIYFYLANELISITENYHRIGLPLPAILKRAVSIVKSQSDEEEKNEKESNEKMTKKTNTERDVTNEELETELEVDSNK
ncbi:phage holin family protein [Paenibacillus polygoni]|uniref:Phage holin family protein n=1 Tax=Paenibacillus polygoni TaxID=3050112 RepID=A0ABY8X829_9BACL|nr:phage holin family protein [Paenibacillus polygoni]WIV20611.1 phage holin family protein [Paenibacillus polygoni]